MCVSNVEQIDLIKWAGRLLYLEIFISLMVAMGYWHIPLTFAFIGAVGSLVYVGFHWRNKSRDDVHKCTLEYISEYPSID